MFLHCRTTFKTINFLLQNICCFHFLGCQVKAESITHVNPKSVAQVKAESETHILILKIGKLKSVRGGRSTVDPGTINNQHRGDQHC